MGRAHTAANVAPCINTLKRQINAAFPNRDKSSDGIWSSPEHTKASPDSDHEYGNAIDFDDDLSGRDGVAPSITPELARQISRDKRCKYTIHDGVIYHLGVAKTYTGANKHTGHLHVSVFEALRAGTADWNLGLGGEDDVNDDYTIRVQVRPDKYAALEKFLRENGIFADGVKYEDGRPVSFPVNPKPHRLPTK